MPHKVFDFVGHLICILVDVLNFLSLQFFQATTTINLQKELNNALGLFNEATSIS